jgi:uncharacterized protein YbaP (TraB family)
MKGLRVEPIWAWLIVSFALLCPIAVFAQSAAGPPQMRMMQVHPALWKIENGPHTVYLFGSLHILPDYIDWTAPEIDTAMKASELFVFEVPVDEEATTLQREYIIKHGLMPMGTSLRRLLTRREYLIYSTILIRAGLKPELFEHYRPWLASLILGLAYLHPDNISTLTGADDALINFAKANGREMRFLETVDQQMALLNTSGEVAQVLSLKRLIETLPRTRTQSEELFASWTAGDADRLEILIKGYFKGYPAIEDRLIGQRNRVWMAQIKQLLEGDAKNALITVGAAHMGGGNGLLSLLCAQGYDVKRVATGRVPDTSVCSPRID